MPPEMLAYLCEFSYIDLPRALVRRLGRGPCAKPAPPPGKTRPAVR